MIHKKLLFLLLLLTPFATSKTPLVNVAADTASTKNKMGTIYKRSYGYIIVNHFNKVLNTSSERIVIDHGLELYKNLQNHESDCFRKVTLSLNDGCNSLTYDSVQNMEYALMLTLCELGSAKWKLPKVCFEISESFNKPSAKTIKQCVKRLSDTPQTWTSYSGYFRDVFLMCFAIRYPLEKDILEQLHQNITLNQAKNYNILQEQQEYLIKWRSEEFNTLNKIKEAQRNLLNQMERVRGTHAKSADQIQFIFDALVLLQNQTEAVIMKYNYLVKYHVGEVQSQLNQLVNRQEFEVDYVMSAVENGLQKINQNIEEMILIQQEALESWSHSKDIQKEYLEAWTQSIIDVNKELNNFLNESLTNVRSLHNDISSIHDQIKIFTMPFEGILNTLYSLYKSVQNALLNLIMYGSLLHLINSLFKYKNLPTRAIIMAIISTVLHFTLRYILQSAHRYSMFIKSVIILAEWFTREVFSAFTLHPNAANKIWSFNFGFSRQGSGKHDIATKKKIKVNKEFTPVEREGAKSNNSDNRSSTQLQKIPVRDHTNTMKKESDHYTDLSGSGLPYVNNNRRRNNINILDEEHERFPMYQFHKYY